MKKIAIIPNCPRRARRGKYQWRNFHVQNSVWNARRSSVLSAINKMKHAKHVQIIIWLVFSFIFLAMLQRFGNRHRSQLLILMIQAICLWQSNWSAATRQLPLVSGKTSTRIIYCWSAFSSSRIPPPPLPPFLIVQKHFLVNEEVRI